MPTLSLMPIRFEARLAMRAPSLRRSCAALALAALLPACRPSEPPPPPDTDIGSVAHAREGMVVSGNPAATRAGAEILGAGGNAVDAAVAAAFALAVAEPTQSGLGGRTQGLVRMADGEVYGIDATTEVPAGFEPARAAGGDYGWGAVAIPGTVAGLTELHQRYGTLALERVMAPAVRLARDGVVVTEGEAGRLRDAAGELEADPGARQHFLHPDGSTPVAGSLFVQPVLAQTIEAIAAGGADAFYRGERGRALAAEMAANGGWVSQADLEAYRAEPAVVVRGRYRDLELIGTYLPASGATTIEALQVLEHFDLATAGADARVAWTAGALMLAFRDREDAVGAPESDARRLTSPEWATARAEELRSQFAPLPSAELEPAHTTHLSVVDAAGNAVSMTQSLGPTGGARVASPGSGFLYASTLGYLDDVAPGDRPWSSQSPLIATREGTLAYVIGGAGARRIISALVSVLTRLEDDGLDLEAALAAPRLHVDAGGITLEGPEDREEWTALTTGLTALGVEWAVREPGVYFARLNAIARDPATGALTGVADPRWPWSGASGPIAGAATDR